ncbi:MAG: hypothetical protein V4757_06685 [Pseudomonadota bacterium]
MTDNSQLISAATYKSVFVNTPAGVAVLDHLHRLYYDNDSFHKDPYVHARNAGRRDVVRHILVQLGIAEKPQEQGDAHE